MSKTFKTSTIFFISCALFVCVRIFAQFAGGMSDNVSDLVFTLIIQVFCYGIVPTGLYMWSVGKGSAKERLMLLGEDFAITRKINPRFIIISFGIGILVYFLNTPIILVWTKFLSEIGYTFTSSVGTIYDSIGVLILQIFLTALLPAVFEEYSQRGLLGAALKDIKSDTAKILLMGLMFALMHQNIVQSLYTFFGGVVISFMYVKTKSIIPGIIVHFTNNFLSVAFDFSSQTGGLLSIIENLIYGLLSHPATILMAFAFWGLLAFLLINTLRRVNYEIKYEKDFKKRAQIFITNLNTQNTAFSEFSNEPKAQTINPFEIFEIKLDSDNVAVAVEPPKKWEYAFIAASMLMCLITTVFTLIWGILR